MNNFEPEVTKESSESEPSLSQPPHHQNSWRWILILIAIAAIGGIWQIFEPDASPPEAAVAQQTTPPRPISTTNLTTGNATREVELLGQVESRQQANIRSRIDGLVEEIFVEPGDRVERGTTIAILDNADGEVALAQAKARLAQAQSNLARLEVGTRPEIIAQRQAVLSSARAREQEAQDNLERTSDLVAQGAQSQRSLIEARSAVDDARGNTLEAEASLQEAIAGPIREEIEAQRANVAAAEAAVNRAEIDLERTQIQAISDGVVQQRHVSAGDYVESADQIATLVASDSLDVFLEVPEELASSIQPGLPVTLNTRALPQWQGRATITGIVPTTDTASRRQRIRVRLDNPPPGLLSGMAVMGNLQLQSDRPSFVISRDAITRREDRWLVYTLADNQAQEIEVEMMADMGDRVAIYNPQLRSGQAIVLSGGDGLSDGAMVKVVR
ncbi:efflux RND transporter periplasmic adaptor subunit [Pleurocapsa sp. CCALA 161]|uniref:efflux RND transporter periplasmic adaptor subunit n=1 Tax=Pleurocapsa sp. CCALA 161 TaxID=2107688 RepID=UPI000D055D6F|nr:efflux RND transporter periplasmic adaptor subunit [Pleurocapsa sp. CCALA 161]PSB12702.1 efflux RND transporter periplasmic adaptor subunit [Pleurocapsa sp. CCALA 161]